MNVIDKDSSIPKDQLLLIVLLGFWVLLGLVELLRSSIMAMGGLQTFDPFRAFSFVSSYIISWSLLTYPILFFFNKFSSFRWIFKILSHLFFSIFFGFFQYILNGLLFALFMHGDDSIWNYFLTGPIQPIPFALNAALIYWVVIFLLLVIDYYHKYREASMRSSRLESQLAQSKLQALRMQLHPHFLFNALNTITMLVRKKQGNNAIQMISGLSDMLRAALTDSDRTMIPLKEELELLKKYLDLEQIRFKETLKITFDIDKSALEKFIPGFILQPLVENAFKHGISKHINESKLRIRAECETEYLIISIFNSGPELSPGWRIVENRGVGLNNTIDRLGTLYQDDYDFEIKSVENKGVEVILKLPSQVL